MSKQNPQLELYVRACAKLYNGAELDPAERFCAANIIAMVLAGNDPRKHMGIKPKLGKPADNAGFFIAVDYWERMSKPGNKDVIVRPIVAKAWRRSASYVFQAANTHKGAALEFLNRGYDARGAINLLTSVNPGN